MVQCVRLVIQEHVLVLGHTVDMVPLLSSCFSGCLSRCKSQNGNKDCLIVLKTRDSDHGADALLTYIAPAFLKRDGFTHVLIYGNATEHIRTTQTNVFQSKKITAKSKHRFRNRT